MDTMQENELMVIWAPVDSQHIVYKRLYKGSGPWVFQGYIQKQTQERIDFYLATRTFRVSKTEKRTAIMHHDTFWGAIEKLINSVSDHEAL